MATEAAFEKIMPAAKIRSLLALSKREPVNVAIGLTADSEGLILLDRKAKPQSLMTFIKSEAGKAKIELNVGTLRFGRAEVDPEYDPAMVRLFLNKKPAGTMRVRLVEVVKKCGFQKVEINVDAQLEAADTEQETEQADTSTEPRQQATAPFDTAGLTEEFAALARRIPEVPQSDPARKRLLELANRANGLLKSGIFGATEAVAQLRRELGAALDADGDGVGQVMSDVSGSAPQPGASAGNAEAALADWQARRSASVASLKAVAGKIAAARHASSAKAIIEIQSVIKNLAAAPSTRRQVTELQKWLTTDGVIQDVSELAEDVRTSLLVSLERLHDQLPE